MLSILSCYRYRDSSILGLRILPLAFLLTTGALLLSLYSESYYLLRLETLAEHYIPSIPSLPSLPQLPLQSVHTEPEIRERPIHVAIENSVVFHNEVWPGFFYALQQMPSVRSSVYINGGPAKLERNNLHDVISSFYDDSAHQFNDLFPALEAEGSDEQIDVLISTTCGEKFPEYNQRLLDINAARKQPFRLVCVLHHSYPSEINHMAEHWQPWVESHRIVFVGLSEHVGRSLLTNLGNMAFGKKYQSIIDYSGVPAYPIVPVFPPAGLAPKVKTQRPAVALIQGNIQSMRRDYRSVFNALQREIDADPALWGWKSQGQGEDAVWVQDSACSDPFQLVLLGQLAKDDVVIPEKLRNVIQIRSNASYVDYFQEIRNADLIIPAFAKSSYFTDVASSTMATAVIAGTSVLVHRRHLLAYTYLDNRGAVLVADDHDPIAAIGRLRTNGTTLDSSEVALMQSRDVPANIIDAFAWHPDSERHDALLDDIVVNNARNMRKIFFRELPDYSFAV